MQLQLRKAGGGKAGKLQVADAVFAAAYNEPLVHQVLTSYLSSGRANSKSLKNRAAVRGGGRKPWRQKGLGRARAGTRNSPIWRGGGVAFASGKRNYVKKVNRKMYRGAMRSILSELVRQERLVCIDELSLPEAKTKAALRLLAELGLDNALIITETVDENLYLAARNLANAAVIDIHDLDPYSLVRFDQVLATQGALKKAEAWLA